MEAFFASVGAVALAEIGDKTQLLAILLASRFRKPVPILLGILAATLANHALAAWAGALIASWLTPRTLAIVLAISFAAMAVWTLFPDKDDVEARPGASVFIATAVSFFFVEMGDKTQLATAALGARYENVMIVAAGTTMGMMLANAPAVFLGEALLKRAPLALIRRVAAALFAVFAALAAWAVFR